MWLDSDLKWQEHVNCIISKLNSFVGLFYKNKYILPFVCRKSLYYSYIYSLLNYGIEVYGLANKTVLSKLLIACNRVLRSLQFTKKDTTSSVLHANFNSLSIYNLFKYNLLKIMYKCVNIPSTVPNYFSNMFTVNHQVHMYNTRNSNLIHLNNNSSPIIYKMSVLWNDVPNNIKNLPSESLFCRALKSYLIEYS